MRKIRLNERQFKKLIKESVMQIINRRRALNEAVLMSNITIEPYTDLEDPEIYNLSDEQIEEAQEILRANGVQEEIGIDELDIEDDEEDAQLAAHAYLKEICPDLKGREFSLAVTYLGAKVDEAISSGSAGASNMDSVYDDEDGYYGRGLATDDDDDMDNYYFEHDATSRMDDDDDY